MTAIGRLGRGVAILGFALLLSAATSSGAAAAAPAQRGPAEHVEARIADLHKKLHITTDQEPQFKAYADVLRSNAQAMQDLFQQRAQAPSENADDRLHWYAKLSAAHADAVNKLVPPFDALYQSLSDKQKKAADAEFGQIKQRRPAHRHG